MLLLVQCLALIGFFACFTGTQGVFMRFLTTVFGLLTCFALSGFSPYSEQGMNEASLLMLDSDPCAHYSDVRPNPFSLSPQERCRNELGSGNASGFPAGSGSGYSGPTTGPSACTSWSFVQAFHPESDPNYASCIEKMRAYCHSYNGKRITYTKVHWYNVLGQRRTYMYARCVNR